jgi:Family of unknown function (DUF5995)
VSSGAGVSTIPEAIARLQAIDAALPRLVQTRSQAREPIQFALAGMAAHINHDLASALFTTCEEFGLPVDDDSAVHRDYQRVDGLLATVETQVAGWFDTGLIADIEDVTPKTTDEAIAMWSLAGARDVAWDHAKILWALRHAGPIRDAYPHGLARTTELAARAMLV